MLRLICAFLGIGYIMASDSDNDAASPSHSAEDSGDQDNGDMVGDQEMEEKNGDQSKDGSQQKKASSNTKDPSRPRRKKARRACYACQRAHLTCGSFLSSWGSVMIHTLTAVLIGIYRRRKTLPTMYQAWFARRLRRWRQEESKIPPRCSQRGSNARSCKPLSVHEQCSPS